MRPFSRVISTSVLSFGVISAAMLGGCSGGGSFFGLSFGSSTEPDIAIEPETPKPTLTEQQLAEAIPSREARHARPMPNFTSAPAPPKRGRSSIIGLYGEQVSRVIADEEPVTGRTNLSQVSFAVEGACFDPAVDPSGRFIAFASTMHQDTANIYIRPINSSTVTQITSDPADDVMPTFSPDGTRIAFASNRAGKWDIYVASVSGGPPVQISHDHDHEVHPTWSPDGRKIAYCRLNERSGQWEIWVVDVENPGVRRFLEYGMFPKWSPNENVNKILFQRPRQRGSRYHGVWTIDYVNGEGKFPTEIVSAANAATINPSWSPDGKRIVFVTVLEPKSSPLNRPGQSDVWVVNLDGNNRLQLTDGQFANYQPIWGADDRVYFVSNRSGMDNIWSVATSEVRELSSPIGPGLVGVNPGAERSGGN